MWRSTADPSTGRVYYFHTNGATQWEKPAGFDQQQQHQQFAAVSSAAEAAAQRSSAAVAAAKQQRQTEDTKQKPKRKRKRSKKNNTWVYVTGFPEDATVEEVAKYFSKCGILQQDAATDKARVKLYQDDNGRLKGDGSVCYLKRPSVELAIQMLDGADFRVGCALSVSEAKFELRPSAADAKASSSAASSAGAERQAKMRKLKQRQALSWNDEGVEDNIGPKVVVLKHLFNPSDAKTPGFLDELEQDLARECGKLGVLKKITVVTTSHEGVAILKYPSSFSAERCVETMNGRWFDGRQLSAEYWDGVTDYRVKGDEEKEEAERIKSFGDWLESQGGDDDDDDDDDEC